MPHGVQIKTSAPGMEAWRPRGEHLTYSEAAWLGAAWGLAMHATLHFFSVAIPALQPLLVLFRPVEVIAFAIADPSAPLARWFLLEAGLAAFWAVAGMGLLAAVREAVALVRRTRIAQRSPRTAP